MKAEIIPAPEYDEADFICLRQVVEALDGSIHNYEGLSIQGPKKLVQRVADVFNSTVKRSNHL